MSRKNKLIIAAIVCVAALAIVLLANFELFSPVAEEGAVEVEKEAAGADPVLVMESEDDNSGVETAGEAIETEFAPAEDPYAVIVEALEDNKPVVLKFYARW